MQSLFDAIVALFFRLCRETGLSYAELNIFVYCALVPLSWLVLVVARQRRYWPLLVVQLIVLVGLLLRHFRLGAVGRHFYRYNIVVLEKLGRTTGWGYVAISLLMGVVIPLMAAGLILAVPRRWVLGVYLLLVAALGSYFWIGQDYA
jgi:uncharacterized membrane protein (UPF0182 family)